MAIEEPGTAAEQAEMDRLEQLLKEPLSKEEAAKEFADMDVLRAKLAVARQRTLFEIKQLELKLNSIDEQLMLADMNKAVTYRRALNIAPQADNK